MCNHLFLFALIRDLLRICFAKKGNLVSTKLFDRSLKCFIYLIVSDLNSLCYRSPVQAFLKKYNNKKLIFSTCVSPESTPRLVPEEGSRYYLRVQHYRELLDSLPMDAYTHGCILHPEITVDSHIPAYAATSIRGETAPDAIYNCFFSRNDFIYFKLYCDFIDSTDWKHTVRAGKTG